MSVRPAMGHVEAALRTTVSNEGTPCAASASVRHNAQVVQHARFTPLRPCRFTLVTAHNSCLMLAGMAAGGAATTAWVEVNLLSGLSVLGGHAARFSPRSLLLLLAVHGDRSRGAAVRSVAALPASRGWQPHSGRSRG